MATTKKAQKFISGKIRKLRHEGKKPAQASAIAFSMARKKGFKVAKR